MKNYKVCWISAGVSSFIAGYLIKDTIDEFIYIDIKDQHPDSLRFIHDCEKVLNKTITILKSKEFCCVDDVCRRFKMINFPYGSCCTGMLKKAVRKEWENEHKDYNLTYVWGFDSNESRRCKSIVDNFPEFNHEFPLIDKNFSKQDCHGLLNKLGIKRPLMYDLGFLNNNCIGCVKGGKYYWNMIRKYFPDVFESRMKLENDLGHSCINGCFLKDLKPNEGRKNKELNFDCGVICYLESMNL